MTLQAISKGFEYYKKFGFNFTVKIFPLIILFGLVASLGASSNLSEGLSNFDISILLINNFLISPLLTIVAIFIANDLFEKSNRDVLVFYVISWKFLIKILVLSLIYSVAFWIGFFLFVIPGILIAGLLLFVNYFAILEDKSVGDSLYLSWNKSKENLVQCILMAVFFWFITILTIAILFSITNSYRESDEIPQIFTIITSSLTAYVQICLVCFPILIFFKIQSPNKIEDGI